MKIIILPTLLLALCTTLANAQAPDTLWTKQLGGLYEDEGFAVQQTVDSCYIVVGFANYFAQFSYEVYLVKLNPFGEVLWERFIGNQSFLEKGFDVKQTTDLGYIIVGTKQPSGGYEDVYLIKTDSLGNVMWDKTFGESWMDGGQSVQQTADDGYIIAGWSRSPTSGDMQVYLIRTDSSGDSLWSKMYGGPYDDFGWSVQQTPDQGFIVAGWTKPSAPNDDDDYYLIKTNAAGDTMWTRTYGDNTTQDRAYSVKHTLDNGYIIVGIGDLWNTWLMKTDSTGDTIWTKTYNPCGRSVQEIPNRGYIIGGWFENDPCLIRTDANGDMLWTRTYGTSDDDWANSASLTSDGGYILVGKTFRQSPIGYPDVYVVKTKPDTLGIEEGEITPIRSIDIGPTILSGPLVLPKDKNCKVFDITGRVVLPDKIKQGIYFIEINGVIAKKVVKVR